MNKKTAKIALLEKQLSPEDTFLPGEIFYLADNVFIAHPIYEYMPLDLNAAKRLSMFSWTKNNDTNIFVARPQTYASTHFATTTLSHGSFMFMRYQILKLSPELQKVISNTLVKMKSQKKRFAGVFGISAYSTYFDKYMFFPSFISAQEENGKFTKITTFEQRDNLVPALYPNIMPVKYMPEKPVVVEEVEEVES